MKLKLLLVTLLVLPAFSAVSLASAADAFAAERTRTGLYIKYDSVGQAHISSSFGLVEGGATDGAEIAFVVSEVEEFSGPSPVDSQVDQVLVWEDPATGEKTYSTVIEFEENAVDEVYTVVSSWYDAFGNQLGSAEDLVAVEGHSGPLVTLSVLNDPNPSGDVVVLKGDLVQVSFSVECYFKWMAAECSAQLGQSSKNDKIQLLDPLGGVIDQTRRGKKTSGLALLKAKQLASEQLVVGYRSQASGSVVATSDTRIAVVADPSTAVLVGQVAALQAQVAELTTALGAANDQIAANQFILIQHMMLESDDVISARVQANTDAIDTLAGLPELVSANGSAVGAIEAACRNTKAPLFYPACEDMFDDVYGRTEVNTAGIGTNAAAVAELGAAVDDNTDAVAVNLTDLNALNQLVGLTVKEVNDDGKIQIGTLTGDGTVFALGPREEVGGNRVQDDLQASFVGSGFTVENGGDQLQVDVFIGLGSSGGFRFVPQDGGEAVTVPFLDELEPGVFSGESENPDVIPGIYRTELLAVLLDGEVLGPLTTFVRVAPAP